MTNQECKKLAKKIAKLELEAQKATDEKERDKIHYKIMALCESVTDLIDMIKLDEEIQKILNKS